jgi:hypothetical protein
LCIILSWIKFSSFQAAFQCICIILVRLLDLGIVIAIFIDSNVKLYEFVPTSYKNFIQDVILISVFPQTDEGIVLFGGGFIIFMISDVFYVE